MPVDNNLFNVHLTFAKLFIFYVINFFNIENISTGVHGR